MTRRHIESSEPDTSGITNVIRFITALQIIGRLIVPLVVLFVSVNVAFAVLDFLSGSVGWGIANTVLATFGAIFLVGVLKHRRSARRQEK